jgi:hypothetical protein
MKNFWAQKSTNLKECAKYHLVAGLTMTANKPTIIISKNTQILDQFSYHKLVGKIIIKKQIFRK